MPKRAPKCPKLLFKGPGAGTLGRRVLGLCLGLLRVSEFQGFGFLGL